MRGLAGRGVLVCGGTSGIGLAAARRFLAEGCRVYVTGHGRDALDAALKDLADLTSTGTLAGGQVFDVRDHERVGSVVADAEAACGAVSVLANNAGIASRTPFLELGVDDWRQVIDVNLTGMFVMAQAFARLLVENARPGSIINMASTNAVGGEEEYAHYNVSKGGVLQLTRTMAIELGAHGIRVNALCPGYIDTPLNADIAGGLDDGFARTYADERIPLGRVGTTDEVAAAYAFLASDDASFIHGTTLTIDGGQTAVM
ncbi:MAG TPA: SDR family oxidoreductase [Jatrophihabitans sp.]|nr:SDR family oxidoreductase [Jatrophihabitans sp.]